jgi:uncharacterized phiE125 gp8 family phage protein
MWQLNLITAPTSEPVTTTEAKLAARIDTTADDALVGLYIKTAREWCESYQHQRAFLTQTWEQSYDYYPAFPIELPLAPVQSVSQITYTVEDGTVNTWDASNYFVDTASIPARIALAPLGLIPTATLAPLGGFKVRFVAGVTSSALVSESVKTSIKLLVSHLYENREASAEKTLSEIPFGVKAILGMDRW